MNALVDVSTQSVTPEQAADWLANHLFERQRKRRSHHVEFLATEMAASRFRRGTVIEFGVLDGKAHLVNGQHTLAAVERFGGPVELVVVRQRVADELELARLYNTHDSGLSRTWTDAYAALNLNNRFRMSDTEINAFGRAAPFIAGGFGLRAVREAAQNRSRDVRAGVMEAYHVAAREYLDCLHLAEPAIRKALLQAPVFALGAFTVAHDQERASRFWSLAADDQNLSKTNPPKVATMLAQRPNNRGQRAMIGLGQSLAAVWNAYVLDREVKRPQLVRTPGDAVRLLRTPLEEEAQGELAPLVHVAQNAAPEAVFDRLRQVFPGAPSANASSTAASETA